MKNEMAIDEESPEMLTMTLPRSRQVLKPPSYRDKTILVIYHKDSFFMFKCNMI